MSAYRRAIVLGLGASGAAAARCLAGEGTDVTAVDAQGPEVLGAKAAELERHGIRVVLGAVALPRELRGEYDVCITSPGIAADSGWLREMRGRGVPVVPELDLGAERCRCRLIGVTGSNGKTTMVKFIREILAGAGFRVEVAGNIGTPLTEAAEDSGRLDALVVEASSFQLELSSRFAPEAGVLMNLFPNHLDRHPDMDTYGAAKARMFSSMKPGSWRIVPDGMGDWLAGTVPEGVVTRTFGVSRGSDYRFAGGAVLSETDSGLGRVSFAGTVFDNTLLGHTAAAATAVARCLGIEAGAVSAAAKVFQPLPHRIQTVADIGGVRYVDDSKGTNLAAMAAAVAAMGAPVRLIAGGLLKEHDLSGVKKVLANRVARIYLIGNSSDVMFRAWNDEIPCVRCGTLEAAFRQVRGDAKPGETVLLSPGCASFDQFSGYGERGQRFVDLVKSSGSTGTSGDSKNGGRR